MSRHDLLIYASMLASSAVLFVFVYLRNLRHFLPFFSFYVTAVFVGGLLTGLVYYACGFRSAPSYYAGWLNVGLALVLRCLAVVELCRHKLRAYRGVWALTWRLLTVLGVLFLVHAAVDAWGQPNRLAIYGLTVERDVGISSILILTATLLVRSYYGIHFETLQKDIAIGLCLLSSVDLINNTMLHNIFMGYLSPWFHTKSAFLWPGIEAQVENANALWWAIRTASLFAATAIWCYALRKPLSDTAPEPVLLPPDVYSALAPAVNLRLRAFNDRLLEMLRT